MTFSISSYIGLVRQLLFLILVSFSSPLYSQNSSTRYAERIDSVFLKTYLYTLTSDSLQGRETGTKGQALAAKYISGVFLSSRLFPLAKDTFQFHPLSIKANKKNNLEAAGKKFLFGRDYFIASSDSDGSLSVNTVFTIDSSLNNEFKRKYSCRRKYKNALLVDLRSGSSEMTDVSSLIPVCNRLHASVVFVHVSDVDSLFRAKQNARIPTGTSTIPFTVVYINDSISNTLLHQSQASRIKPGRPYLCEVTIPLTSIAKLQGANVPYLLKGRNKPDEVILVTAHYDHLGVRNDTIFRGADDDASGTSTVLELARVFALAASEGQGPDRSILFMPVSGEEKGLLGSSYYAQHPLIPLEKTVADLNIDMVGRTDPKHDSTGVRDYIYIIGDDKLSSQLHRINTMMNDEYTKLELDYTFNVPGDPNRFYFRSDHYNFAKHGVPVSFYFNGTHRDYHKSTDTPDKIDFTVMRKRVQLIFYTLWELANREERIIVDQTDDMDSK